MSPAELALKTGLQPLRPIKPGTGTPAKGPQQAEKKTAFSKVLANELAAKSEATQAPKTANGIEFSAHALARLQERNITLSPHNLARLDHGVQLAGKKGSVNTLVLLDDNAFIVSVKNKRVITAITKDASVDNVFTQIDSATIV